MSARKRLLQLLILCALAATLPVQGASTVQVKALFKNAALLKVDGHQKLVKAGQTFAGVRLVEANAQRAIVELDGGRLQLDLSTAISGQYQKPGKQEITIPINQQRQYITNAEINGIRAKVLVDTGANVVAINSAHARQIGLNYKKGQPSRVSTASGVVPAYRVKLDSVEVNGIRVNHVQASVIEGNFPQDILLGMSFLQHVDMREKDGLLYLTQKY